MSQTFLVGMAARGSRERDGERQSSASSLPLMRGSLHLQRGLRSFRTERKEARWSRAFFKGSK